PPGRHGKRRRRGRAERYRRTRTERRRDLRDGVHVRNEVAQHLLVSLARELDVVGDTGGCRGSAREIAVDMDEHPMQTQAPATGLPEQVVRDARGDREMEQLATAEALPAATRRPRTVHDERVRSRATERGDL